MCVGRQYCSYVSRARGRDSSPFAWMYALLASTKTPPTASVLPRGSPRATTYRGSCGGDSLARSEGCSRRQSPLCNRDLKPGFMHTRLRTCSLSLSGGRWRQTSERGKTTQHIAFSPPLPHARVKKNVCSLDSPACKQRNSRLGAQYPVQYPRKRGFYPRRKMTPWHERQIAKICHLCLAGWKGEGELEDL